MQEKESWDLNKAEEKIEAAGKKKEEGNVLFKAGKYERASRRYEKVFLKFNRSSKLSRTLINRLANIIVYHQLFDRLSATLNMILLSVTRRSNRARH